MVWRRRDARCFTVQIHLVQDGAEVSLILLMYGQHRKRQNVWLLRRLLVTTPRILEAIIRCKQYDPIVASFPFPFI